MKNITIKTNKLCFIALRALNQQPADEQTPPLQIRQW